MTESVSLVPVKANEVSVGNPLPWPVYDWHGNLLLAAGVVVASQGQLDDLLDSGFIQDESWDLNPQEDTVAVAGSKKDSASVALRAEEITSKQVPKETPKETAKDMPKDVIANMDDVRWYVGETLYLQLHDNSNVRYTVKLIGFVKHKTVFVTAPVVDGKFALVRDGQTFIVRAFSGKKAFAFTAAAIKSVHTPHPYLHLSYPKQIRCTIVRQSARAQVKLIAAVSLEEPNRTAAATIIDLSMGGCSGNMKEPVGKKGEKGRIKFKVNAAQQDTFLSLSMILRSVLKSENGDGFRHGFEFVDMSTNDKLVLSAFVHQSLVESD